MTLVSMAILIYAIVSPIPFLWMWQQAIGNHVISVTIVDDMLQIVHATSHSGKEAVRQMAEGEQSYINQVYRSVYYMREGVDTTGWGDSVMDLKTRMKDFGGWSPFRLTHASPWPMAVSRTGNNVKTVNFAVTQLFCRLWVLMIVLPIYPTIVFIRGPYRRYRRRKKGLCLKCGYDLTGNVSGVCPECGEGI